MKFDSSYPIFSKVLERDIDILLLEKIETDELFREWFLDHTSRHLKFEKEKIGDYIGIWHSVHKKSTGETDLLIKFKNQNIVTFFLIENKVDSPFTQLQQNNYYQKRIEEYISEGQCDIAYSVLVCPDSYPIPEDLFDIAITYQNIIEQLEKGSRQLHFVKLNLLHHANSRQVRKMNFDQVEFNTNRIAWVYYKAIEMDANLNPSKAAIKDSKGKGKRSKDIRYHVFGKTKGAFILHRMNEDELAARKSGHRVGIVIVKKYFTEDQLNQFKNVLSEYDQLCGLYFDKSNSEMYIRKLGPPLNGLKSVELSAELLIEGIEIAIWLTYYAKQNLSWLFK